MLRRDRMRVGNTDGKPFSNRKQEASHMDKCYIYMRVSTEAQVDGYSLDAQEKRIEEYAEYIKLIIVALVIAAIVWFVVRQLTKKKITKN